MSDSDIPKRKVKKEKKEKIEETNETEEVDLEAGEKPKKKKVHKKEKEEDAKPKKNKNEDEKPKKKETNTTGIDNETEETLRERLDELNHLIRHFRNIGYATAADGTLYVPKALEHQDTGTDAKIKIVGNTFYLDVGGNRDHNEYIKALDGHWKQYAHAWQFYGLKNLDKIKDSFNIIELVEGEAKRETKPPSEAEKQKKVLLCIMGDYIGIRGYTKPIKEDIKTIQGYRWDGELTQWTIPKKQKEKLDALMEKLKDSEKIGDYEYVED